MTSRERSLKDAAELTGLEPALIERFWTSLGLPAGGARADQRRGHPGAALRRVACSAPASRWWPSSSSAACTARRSPRSPTPRCGSSTSTCTSRSCARACPGSRWRRRWRSLARDLLPIASPMMDYVHRRFLQHFVEQDVVGHMESELEDEDVDLGRVRVAIAFADLAGYTRFTEEEGEEEALSSVERFVEGVTNTLPDDARVVKTIGDEVMVVGQDVQRAGGLGGRLRRPVRRASRAAHRHPLGNHPLPRRRLLRPRRQPRLARGGARPRRRGARDATRWWMPCATPRTSASRRSGR